MVTDRERFFFDLQGYLVLENAIDPEHVKACNEVLDGIINLDPPLKHGEWYGGVHAHTFGGADGVNLQQIYEAGEPFERLLDHPSWWDHVREFVGGQSNFDAAHGPLFIDENFASLRGPGEALGIHSGGHEGAKRNQFRYHLGEFMCGQVNILLALTDIGPGDGGTMLIPGSHKANFAHPQFEENVIQHGKTTSLDDVEGAIEVHMKAGDALLFVDTICHGSAKRVNEDLRRICVFRYGPSWGFFRGPYRPTRELLERLTEQRRQIVWPHEPVLREPNRKPGFENPPKILPE
ncbi:MAG: hypothetical protein GVY10_06005 [Verrucomicrobia bacterium]|jgi:hypothetical protein|nr:hypothetical protein [Verrucomicrobiota bacterium]